MKTNGLQIAACATICTAVQAGAQTQAESGQRLPPIFAVMDTDHDGKISTDEWAGTKETFARPDTNGGRLHQTGGST